MQPLLPICSFRSSLRDDPQQHPKGLSIAEFIKAGLEKDGYRTSALDNYNDIAWSLDVRINGARVWFFVGFLGLEAAEWQLITCSGLSFWQRLFGRKDEKERQELAVAIHRLLSQSDTFSSIKWSRTFSPKGQFEWRASPA